LLLEQNKTMLQRIQTVYLLIAALISGGLCFLIPYGTDAKGVAQHVMEKPLLLGLFISSALLSLIAICVFKNRQLQFVLGRLNILLNLITLGVFVYGILSASGEASVALEKGVGKLIPVISIVFIVLANKAIKRDEQLVKSVDRLR